MNIQLLDYCKIYTTSYGKVLLVKDTIDNSPGIRVQAIFKNVAEFAEKASEITLPFEDKSSRDAYYDHVSPEQVEKMVELQYQAILNNHNNPFNEINLN